MTSVVAESRVAGSSRGIPVSDQATDTDEASSETAPQAASHRIGLALSGGGIRAAVSISASCDA